MGSATLSQLAFPRQSKSNFPREKSHWDNIFVKKKSSMAYILLDTSIPRWETAGAEVNVLSGANCELSKVLCKPEVNRSTRFYKYSNEKKKKKKKKKEKNGSNTFRQGP